VAEEEIAARDADLTAAKGVTDELNATLTAAREKIAKKKSLSWRLSR
jgi:hypothetical protein